MLIISSNSAAAEQKVPSKMMPAKRSSLHTIYWSVHTNTYKGDDYALLISGVIQEDRFHSFSSECSKLLLFFPAIVFCGSTSISFTIYA